MKRNLFVVFMVLALALTACSVTVNNGNTQAPAAPVQVNVTVEQNANQQVDVKPAGCTTCAAQLVAPAVEAQETTTVPAPAPTAVAPANTEMPKSTPEAAATVIPIVEVPCESIQVSTDNGATWVEAGEELDTELGHRVTWTNRRTVVPKQWNEALSDAELKLVETTWVRVRINTCNTSAIVFTGGIKIKDLQFNQGALFEMSGVQEFDLRNGEVVLWFDASHRATDLQRIVKQIREGNFDIHSKLAFAVTDSLKDQLPADLMSGVQVVLLP